MYKCTPYCCCWLIIRKRRRKNRVLKFLIFITMEIRFVHFCSKRRKPAFHHQGTLSLWENQIGLVNTEMNNDANLGTQLTIIAAGNKDQTTCCILGVRDVKFFSISYIIYTLYYMIGVKQTLLQFRKPRKTINFRPIQKWQSIEIFIR